MLIRFSRDELLGNIAKLVARRSTCLRSSVGALLAREGRIISMGYNGAPAGMRHCEPETCGPGEQCTRTVHAEANAIAFAAKTGIETNGSTLYTTHSPCNDCAKLLINAGICRVIYWEAYHD
ncbi:MAG: deoxycytidylate deaminase, partial [Candidatus Thorarchaeota archaeon]